MLHWPVIVVLVVIVVVIGLIFYFAVRSWP